MGWKRVAQRMALFIQEFGVGPELVIGTDYGSVAQALQGQYLRLRQEQPERVVEVRTAARQKIRTLGLEAASAGLISVTPSTGNGKYKKSKAHLKRWFERHPDEAVPCPHCRMNCGLRKRAWLSRELAQAARERAGSGYRVYPCPEQEGYWHVGHSKKAKKRRVKESLCGPILTPKEG